MLRSTRAPSLFTIHRHELIISAEHHSASIDSPSFYNGISENAARRTPQPTATEVMADSVPFDPYATQTLQSLVTGSPMSYGAASGPNSAFTGYSSPNVLSASSQSYPNDRPSPYEPYAPPALANTDPYAPKRSVSGLNVTRAGPSNLALAAAPKPAAPKRMASNAYDPPFLKPQKSFIRSASAIPMVAPAFAAPSMTSAPPNPVSHVAPPVGPPRRSQTDQRQLNRNFSYAAPAESQPGGQAPPTSIPRISTTHATASGRASTAMQDLYPSPADGDLYGSAEGSYQPPQRPASAAASTREPPTKASYAAFDPPLRAASQSVRSPYVSPLIPAPAFSPPPLEQGQAPPRSGSRNLVRKASPIFQARTPSRSSPIDHGQRMMNAVAENGYRTLPNDLTDTRNDLLSNRSSPEQRHRLPMPEKDSGDIEHDRPEFFEQSIELEYKDEFLPSLTEDQQATASGTVSCEPQDRHRYPDILSRTSGSSLDRVDSSPPKMPIQPPYDPYAPTTNGYEDYNASSPHTTQQAMHEIDANARRPISSYEPASYTPSPYKPTDFRPEQYVPIHSPNRGNHVGSTSPPADYFRSTTQQDDTYVPHQVLEQRPVSEDPLGRSTLAARNLPLAVFGFGGVLITAFPATADDSSAVGHARTPSYGYASGRGQIWLRRVSDHVADTALRSQNIEFPGPLVFDPASPKGSAGEKKKRDAVMAYLGKRAEEIEQGLPYLKSSASKARREQEGKLVVLRLLAAMIDGDGKLSGRLGSFSDTRMSCSCLPTVRKLKRTSAMPCNLPPHHWMS